MTGSPDQERGTAMRFTRTPTPTRAPWVSSGDGAGHIGSEDVSPTSGTRRGTVVRPRRVWGGLALALLGVAGAGIGLMSSSWLLVIAGGLVLALGACLSWAGGVMHDATTRLDLRSELQAVRDGTTHPGVAAGAQTGSPAAHDEAARQSRVTQQVLDRALQATPAGWTRPAGWTLLLIAAVLLVSQWVVVAHTATGRSNSYRDTALAIVLAFTGLRLALTRGPHRVAAVLTGLAGLVVLLTGVLAGHDHTSLAVVEGTTGVLTLVCAAAAAFSPAGSG
jgi:drug/metabolite transporter (DMT)-like permease